VWYRYEGAGDQYVGRVLSGLPLYSKEFATLPPHFKSCDHSVNRAIDLCFPTLDSSNRKLRKVLEFCLASVVYHFDYLQRVLPVNHVLFENVLFREVGVLEALSHQIVCRVAVPEDDLSPTGIPPHVLLLTEMHFVRDDMNDLRKSSETAVQGGSGAAQLKIAFKGK
jgi:hypothetical protein